MPYKIILRYGRYALVFNKLHEKNTIPLCIVLLSHVKFGSAIIILNICYTLYVARNENYSFFWLSREKNVRIGVINQFRNSPRSRDISTTYTISKNTIISNNRKEQKKIITDVYNCGRCRNR